MTDRRYERAVQDGMLVRFLDGQTPVEESGAVRAVLQTRAGRARLDDLREESARVSDLVGAVETTAPPPLRMERSASSRWTGWAGRAAVVTLLLSAGGAAALPPVRSAAAAWVSGAMARLGVVGERGRAEVVGGGAGGADAAVEPGRVVGIPISAGTLLLELEVPEPNATLIVERYAESSASASAARVELLVLPDRVRVLNAATPAGRVVLHVPPSAERLRVVIGTDAATIDLPPRVDRWELPLTVPGR